MNISFIIPAYNCEATILESIESIYNDNFQEYDELVVVNDGSTDNTANLIKNLQLRYPKIKLCEHTKNRGSGTARDTAIENSSNDVIFCLDSDNVLAPGSIQKLRNKIVDYDIVSFQELHYFKTSINYITHKWTFKEGLVTLADCFSTIKVPGASGNYMFTKASWVKAGGYPEYTIALDTWGFGIAQLATGSKMYVVPDSFYYHRWGHDSHWVRGTRIRPPSLIALRILIPFLNLLDDDDVDYIFSRKGRYTWLDELDKKPLRLKGQ